MVNVEATQGTRSVRVSASENTNLLELLQENGFRIAAVCGGQGTCGKCLVTLKEDEKETVLPACTYRLTKDCTVIVPDPGSEKETGIEAETPESASTRLESAHSEANDQERAADNNEECDAHCSGNPVQTVAAVDLGTTTVAVRVLRFSDGIQEEKTTAAWNRQTAFGADVISRIQYISDHPDGLKRLSDVIQNQILEMCSELLPGAARPDRIFIAGNTIMQHIAAGISPESIAKAPFTPQTLFADDREFDFDGIPVRFSPCVAGYVGGDITSGLYSTETLKTNGTVLFLDIGTNGEMALIRNHHAVLCSVASGPAFEGAGIRCGMTSTNGAIRKAHWTGTSWELDVIGGGEATGICGSGLLDLASELIRSRIVDGGGRLLPPDELPEENAQNWLKCIFEDENGNGLLHLTESVVLTAADIRQLQLAKAAVRAGIEILLQHENISADEVDEVVIAGGFGSHMNVESAVRIRMIPENLKNRTRSVGNSSLAGMTRAARQFAAGNAGITQSEFNCITDVCTYLELSGMEDFNDEYIDQMYFYEEEEEWN